MTKQCIQPFSWENIDRIFLDLDGTLLDKYYDDYFWEDYVVQTYSNKNQVEPKSCRELMLATYKSVENTLQWTDLDYWSERLGLDIAALKKEISHLINIHPHVLDFFDLAKKRGKKLYLVTNAHPKTLAVKLGKIKITDVFTKIICSQDVGFAKEQLEFWSKLPDIQTFDKNRTLFVDDTEKVLDAAKEYGIKHLIHIAKPSSKLAPIFSRHYPSVKNFKPLIF
ncbi:MAG: haloacid dehalogenase [Desulfotalea sp.]|nr:MAG: haloacid dehalogenase [Desulfotalea sp.]